MTGIKPDFAIGGQSLLLFLQLVYSDDIKSVGGRQYGFNLFFNNEDLMIILFNSIIEFLTIATPLGLYFFSLVCISYFTDQYDV